MARKEAEVDRLARFCMAHLRVRLIVGRVNVSKRRYEL